jgi:hypothetical protein
LTHPAPESGVRCQGLLWSKHSPIGERWDESKLTALLPGSFFYEPPHVPHFAWAKDGEVILQLTAIGPTGTTVIPQKSH